MAAPVEVTLASKWSVGFSPSIGRLVVSFHFNDQSPHVFALSRDNAKELADAILKQLQSVPKVN